MSRKPRRLLLAGLGVALAVLIAWPVTSAWAAGRVWVSVGELVSCVDGASVSHRPTDGSGEDGPLPPPTMVAVDDKLDCVLRTELVNDSVVPVSPLEFTWPVFGPGAGAGVLAQPYPEGGAWALVSAPDDTDAVLAADEVDDLAGGSRTEHTIRVVKQPGCLAEGSVLSVPDAPVATIRVLGLRHTISAHGTAVGFRGTADSSCVEGAPQ